jgi:hypothetical protein
MHTICWLGHAPLDNPLGANSISKEPCELLADLETTMGDAVRLMGEHISFADADNAQAGVDVRTEQLSIFREATEDISGLCWQLIDECLNQRSLPGRNLQVGPW